MTQQVAVVGFGYVGACIGAVLAEKRFNVTGIDRDPATVKAINSGKPRVNEPGLGDLVRDGVVSGRLRATTSFDPVADSDIVVVTVGTPLGPESSPDQSQVEAAVKEIASHLQIGQLVLLKSTVPPGTTEGLVRPLLEESGLEAGVDFDLAFCPERLAEGKALQELLTLPVVVGGVNESSTQRAAAFWREALGVETISVSSPQTAELAKLADNLWIDVSIAVANELAILCDRLGIDVLQVISAANSLPKGEHKVNILLPSVGVGGSCLTKDPWFLHHLAAQQGVDLRLPVVSRTVNDSMPEYTYHLIERELSSAGKEIRDAAVAVLGIAFKNNTGDIRNTPVGRTLELLERSGCDLRIHDPWVSEADAATLLARPLSEAIGETIHGADCIAFLAGHDDYRRLTVEELLKHTAPGCVIVDGRMYFEEAYVEELLAAGFRFRGIGR